MNPTQSYICLLFQEKKLELLDALFKMDNGGDPNALLQVPSIFDNCRACSNYSQ